MKRILVVEDEYAIRDLLALNLERGGYSVVCAASGERALDIFDQDSEGFDIVLLDIMLPGISGFEVCESIRGKNQIVGIIMLSAKTQEADKVTGLAIGADDYVTKPFSVNELAARVDAVYRRTANTTPSFRNDGKEIVCGNFTLNFDSRILKKNGEPLELTQVEFHIMKYFMENPGRALDRDSILKRVWSEKYHADAKIVDVNIRRLRMKIEDEPAEPRNIVTVWGYGYRWSNA